MILDINTVEKCATGIRRAVLDSRGLVTLHRFTEREEELYREKKGEGMYAETLCTAGVRLVFKTNSDSFGFSALLEKGTSRNFWSFELYSDGELVGTVDNLSGVELPDNYSGIDIPFSQRVEAEFSLPAGEKLLTLYFPWSAKVRLERVTLSDGAFVTAVKRDKVLVAYGDSITHGHDAVRSAAGYANRLADMLGADLYNLGIGGEIFFPSLAQLADIPEPDYVTVAYGTNDWNGRQNLPLFHEQVREFYSTLSEKYPKAKIFAISPIWRYVENDTPKPLGPFSEFGSLIEAAVKDLPNVIFISGYEFIPEKREYFADLHLHPNDEGFRLQANALYKEIKKHI